MKQRLFVFICMIAFLHSFTLNAQKPLPEFELKELSNGKVLVSWLNPYKNCVKLSVQRSVDLNKFQTLVWARNPDMHENEFLDQHPEKGIVNYYRIYYVLKGGKYFFTNPMHTNAIMENAVKKDPINSNSIEKNALSKIEFKPSKFVISIKKGNVVIRLPEARKHKYSLIFYEENGDELFHINQLKETELFLDKTNFIHAGWFGFELFEDEKLKEKNKILVTID